MEKGIINGKGIIKLMETGNKVMLNTSHKTTLSKQHWKTLSGAFNL